MFDKQQILNWFKRNNKRESSQEYLERLAIERIVAKKLHKEEVKEDPYQMPIIRKIRE